VGVTYINILSQQEKFSGITLSSLGPKIGMFRIRSRSHNYLSTTFGLFYGPLSCSYRGHPVEEAIGLSSRCPEYPEAARSSYVPSGVARRKRPSALSLYPAAAILVEAWSRKKSTPRRVPIRSKTCLCPEIKLSGKQLHSTRTTRKSSSCLVQNQAAYIVQVLSRLPTERVPRPLSRMCRGSECMELYTHFRIRLHGVMLN
jgi:hypothetical protein